MIHGQRITLDAHTFIWYYHEESNTGLIRAVLNDSQMDVVD